MITSEHIADLKQLLLFCTHNIQFKFNDKIYRQKDGVAMGSPLGPILADIFMSSLENTKLKQFIDGFVVYKRYVDDIFCVTEENIDLKELVNCFDSAHSNIKFSVEPEFENQLNFLDVTLKRQSDGSIQRSIHRKPTWSGQYTHFSSFVPVKIKKNLIICLTDRVRRLCSEDTVDKELLFLRQVFINNGYPERLLDKYEATTTAR